MIVEMYCCRARTTPLLLHSLPCLRFAFGNKKRHKNNVPFAAPIVAFGLAQRAHALNAPGLACPVASAPALLQRTTKPWSPAARAARCTRQWRRGSSRPRRRRPRCNRRRSRPLLPPLLLPPPRLPPPRLPLLRPARLRCWPPRCPRRNRSSAHRVRSRLTNYRRWGSEIRAAAAGVPRRSGRTRRRWWPPVWPAAW